MSDKTFKVLVGCQVDLCAGEVSYPLDMLRWWKDAPICEECFSEIPALARMDPDPHSEVDDPIRWTDLEPLKIEQARA